MNKTQASNLIQSTFPEAFDKARFHDFAINILNRLDESKAQQWSTQYVKDAFKGHVSRYERLGTYTSPDKETIDVLIVYLTAESKLERARTALRNFAADHLKKRNEKDAALVAFVSPTEKQWRLSYVKMEYATVEKESGKIGVETRLTPARRFSYLVGEGESCHTAQTRFLDLLQDTDTDPTLAQIEEAFSVEAVTKEFFAKYAELFGDITAGLDKLVKKDKILRDEFKAKGVDTVEFAKKLMGQIVFLYFLQKKGWLGVEKGKDWGTGPRDFLRRLADSVTQAFLPVESQTGMSVSPPINFFNDVLEPLFYDTLATDRGHEAWCDHFKCRIPFLNGGLFEPLGDYDWKKTDIIIPDELFRNSDFVDEGTTGTGVLDVFDRYNFTVNEAEPLEMEVAIDPEMLGKVFENLIEENRRKGLGAYYTPREIVHYMCQESLINYLDTKCKCNTDIPVCESQRDTDIPVCDSTPQAGMPVSPSPSDINITRRNLPHWTRNNAVYWITFRLADSLPQEKVATWKAERDLWIRTHPEPWDDDNWTEYNSRFGKRLEDWLDAGHGSCVLARPDIRRILQDCLLRFDGERLRLNAGVIMPNHVHILLEPLPGQTLAALLKGIKGASARGINKVLEATGTVWMDESYDHIVRSEVQYRHFIRYIENNPIKAKLKPEKFWLYQCDTDIPVCDVCDEKTEKTTGRNACVTLPRADIETFIRLGEQISHYEAVDAKYVIKMPKSIKKSAKSLDEALTPTLCRSRDSQG